MRNPQILLTACGAAIMREVYAFARAMAILLGKHAWPGFPVPGRRQPKHTVLQRVKHLTLHGAA